MIFDMTSEQLDLASWAARLRWGHHLAVGSHETWGAPPGTLNRHYEGTIGEVLVATEIGTIDEWRDGVEKKKTYWERSGDVAAGVFVRSTSLASGRLILHPPSTGGLGDPPDGIYVSVRVHTLPHVEIAGWLNGRDGQLSKYWWDHIPRPAFFIPSSKLMSWDGDPRLVSLHGKI